jgi:hypothetical protein
MLLEPGLDVELGPKPEEKPARTKTAERLTEKSQRTSIKW